MNGNAAIRTSASATKFAEARVAACDWEAITGELDSFGCAVLPKLLEK
jgi:hypothetical protein